MMHPRKNVKVWAGSWIWTRTERMIICRARIMPHRCCIEPPRMTETKMFPDDIRLTRKPPVSVVEEMSSACSASRIIGGETFLIVPSPSPYALLSSGLRSLADLKRDSSFT